MDKKIKKIITILLILAVICVIFIFVFSRKNKLSSTDFSKDSQGIEDYIQIEENNTIIYENSKNVYYTVVSIVNKYINEAARGNQDKLLNMLDLEYTENSNIDEITGISPLNDGFQYYVFVPTTIYSMDEAKITTHFVYGYYYNNLDMNKKELNLMVELDSVNQTFNIHNYNYILNNGYNNLQVGDVYKTKLSEIQNRGDNTFTYISMSDEDMASKYLDNFREVVLYNKDQVYKMLDQEYSKLKFKNEEDFNSFVNNKKIEFFTAELKEYNIKTNELGNKVYICRDQNDNYYYFEETEGIMQYKIVLDNYVLANDEFKNKYNNASEQQKVVFNIEKFIQAINDESYYYAYNCLADSYKNNYFKTQEEFEIYAKETFYGRNVEYKVFNTEREVYTYSVVFTNKETEEQTNKTFIMQLGEGTEFVMSFNK